MVGLETDVPMVLTGSKGWMKCSAPGHPVFYNIPCVLRIVLHNCSNLLPGCPLTHS